jgi:hypothetical protein
MNNLDFAKQLGQSVYADYLIANPFLEVKEDEYKKPILVPLNVGVAEARRPFDVSIPVLNVAASSISTNPGLFNDAIVEAFDGIMNYAMVEIGISETGGANPITLCDSPHFLDSMQIFGNGGASTELQRIYGDNIFTALNCLTNEQLTVYAPYLNTSASWGAGTSILASGSATYFIPILGFFGEYAQFYPRGMGNSSMLFRHNWCKATAIQAGTGVCGITRINLHVGYTLLPESDKEALRQKYNQTLSGGLYSGIEFPVLTNVYSTLSATYTLSTTVNTTLTWVNGEVAFMIAIFRSVKGSTTGYITYIDPTDATTIQVLDSASQSVLSPSSVRYDTLKILSIPLFQNTMLSVSTKRFIPIVFCDSIADALFNGKKKGLYRANTKDVLQINFSSAFSTGAYILDIYAAVWAHIHISQGKFTVINPN